MKNIITYLTLLSFLSLTTGCGSFFSKREHKEVQKSPCVDNSGPCKHIPINNWWLPESKQINYNA